MRPGPRLLLIFVVAILVPGLILGFFGVRGLVQEGLLIERQTQARLEAVARGAGFRLESELNEWQQAVREIARSGTTNRADWPERVRRAVATPGAAVVLTGSFERAEPYPHGQLLYELPATAASSAVLPPWLAEADQLELRDKRYEQAIELYRRLLKDAATPDRAVILRGLAAALKNAGRASEALETYHLLATEPSRRIGSLPSDLIALYEIAAASTGHRRADLALDIYRSLVAGRWQLQKENYGFYAAQARAWSPSSDAVRELAAEEEQKLALTLAAEAFLRRPASLLSDGAAKAVAFWSDQPFAAVIARQPFAGFLQGADTPEFVHAIVTPDGQVLAGVAAAPEAVSATYAVRSAALPLRVAVAPRDPAAMPAVVRRQRRLYAGVLVIVVALLALGGYFTMRTLRGELAVAQMKSDFMSTVSHEFRSPLAGINQLAEMLRDGRINDETRRGEYYEMLVTETRRLRRLVENVLDFSRMEDGRKQYRFEPLQPAPWLRELAADFQTQIAAAGFEVETNIPPALPTIRGDRETLTTAVHNLLDNAVKYSPTTKSIRVEATADEAVVSISVSDRGVGIAEEDRPRIFEKFYRGGGALAHQVKGVGLGLNLVHHIVAAHGGTVVLDTRVGVGSTFTIRLHRDAHPAG